MLVLSRKNGQRITIGDNISIVVIAIQGSRVKLGIEGPADVPIHRAEIVERIRQEASVADGAKSIAGGESDAIEPCRSRPDSTGPQRGSNRRIPIGPADLVTHTAAVAPDHAT